MSPPPGTYTHLIYKIDDFIRRYYINKILRGAIYLSASIFTGFVIVTFAEYFGNFTPTVRTALFYSYLLLNVYILGRWIVLPLLAYYNLGKTITHEQAAEIIGQHFLPVKDKLLNTLQLKRLSESNAQDRTLIEASINQKIAELNPVPFRAAVRLNENKKYIKYVVAPLLLILLISFTAPAIFSESTERLLKYNQPFIKEAPFNFVILNEKLTAVQGDDYELEVKLTGEEIPNEIYLEDGPNTYKLEKESIIRFKHTFKNIQDNRKIRLVGGKYHSDTYTIEVKRKPALLNFDVQLEYPGYLKKKNETVANAGDLTVPVGTRVRWDFNAQNSNRLEIALKGKRIALNPIKENLFRLSHRAMETITYQVRPVNGDVIVTDAGSYQLTIIPDLHPAINVNEKQDSVNSKVLYFVGQVNDDHGLTRLTFNYRVLNGANQKLKTVSRNIPFDRNTLQSNFFHVWNVSEIQAEPGDQIEYFFEVSDNDGVTGPKSMRSQARIYKIPTNREVDKMLENGSTAIKDKMTMAIKKAAEIEKEAKSVNRDLLDKKSLTYEDKKQIEQLLQHQKEFDQLIKEIQAENKQNMFDRQELKQQRQEILEKQKQIENLFNNVLDEKTREILKNIEKLLEQNNKNVTQNELSRMQIDNKTLQKELDRILELYKQLEFDQKLVENIDKLNELSKEQKRLAEETLQKNSDKNSLKEKQDQLNEKFKDVRKGLNELEQKNEQLSDKNNLDNSEKEQETIEKEQEKSTENLENSKMKQAAENQQKAGSDMQKLSEKLEQMRSENEAEESQVNIRALREILDNLLTSSFDQEKVMQNLRTISAADPGYVVQSQKQKDIQDNLRMIQDSLYSLSKKVPQIESVVNKEIQQINTNVAKSLELLAERRTAEANKNQQFAMTSINNLALMLSEALDQLQKVQQNAKSSGKGKKPSLSQLSKMQEQLNKNMQKAREQMQKQGQDGKPGQQSSKGPMSEQMAKMAREQQMIRQAMQDINRELNKNGKGDLGNLGELMKEMEQTETDLVHKRIQRETLIRQQDILSKLLEAEKAERERELEEQRESKSGQTIAPNYSIILKEYQKLKQRELELLKTVPPSLNSFYKNKVGDYFKFLNSDNKYVK